MSNISLSVNGIGFTVKKRKILSEVKFQVNAGSVFAVVGHNGAGKTTLFHLILGFKTQTAGEIELLGTSNLNFKCRAKVGYVPERPYVHLEQTLRNFLNFHAELMDLSRNERKEQVSRVANEVGLGGHLDYSMTTFSKGMLQKSVIAQASLGQPDLYILDEPMSGLDPDAREAIKSQIIRIKQSGKTVIFSSHAFEDVELLADEVVSLKAGKVQFKGSVSEWKQSR